MASGHRDDESPAEKRESTAQDFSLSKGLSLIRRRDLESRRPLQSFHLSSSLVAVFTRCDSPSTCCLCFLFLLFLPLSLSLPDHYKQREVW